MKMSLFFNFFLFRRGILIINKFIFLFNFNFIIEKPDLFLIDLKFLFDPGSGKRFKEFLGSFVISRNSNYLIVRYIIFFYILYN
jgi:hypothetical protein